MEIKIFITDKKVLMLGGKKDYLVNLKDQTAFNLVFTPEKVVSQNMTGDEMKFVMQNLQASQTINDKDKQELMNSLEKIQQNLFVKEHFD